MYMKEPPSDEVSDQVGADSDDVFLMPAVTSTLGKAKGSNNDATGEQLAGPAVGFQIAVRFNSTWFLDVEPGDTVRTIKRLIAIKEGIDIENLSISNGRSRLIDDKMTPR